MQSLKTQAMGDHGATSNTGLLGMILTGISLLYARITASELASVFTMVLAATNLVIAWPKLKLRLVQIQVILKRWFKSSNDKKHKS